MSRPSAEIPPVTDWEDFAGWCKRNGRVALPASQETLSLYFAERASVDPHRGVAPLALLSLSFAVTGILIPLLLGACAVLFANAKPDLAIKVCGLCVVGLQLIAFGAGLVSRGAPAGRAGLTIAIVSSLLVGAYFVAGRLGFL